MIKERSIDTLPLDGGALPFHLINTVYAWKGENVHEYLKNYADFLEWTGKVKLLKKKEVQALKATAAEHPAKAKAAYKEVIYTRDLLYHFFSAVASGTAVPAPLLNRYTRQIQEALLHFEWTYTENKLQFVSKKESVNLLHPLWLVLKAAHDLLLQTDQTRIKECPRCGWIFLDSTKNGSRRWCSPETCGSSEKSRKYYHEKVKALKK